MRKELGTQEKEEYYFRLLRRAFDLLLKCYGTTQGVGGASSEEGIVRIFLERMIHTVEALRMKYSHDADRTFQVDLSASGLPLFVELSSLSADFVLAKERLESLPGEDVLRRAALDFMFKERRPPLSIFWKLSQRAYYESLNAENLFLPFTPGEIVLRGESEGVRQYLFSWASYDVGKNRPLIHILRFDHDGNKEALENGGGELQEFINCIRLEGGHESTLLSLATKIDDYLPAIHPKYIKRVGIGPLLLPDFMNGEQRGHLPSLMKSYGEGELALEVRDEIIFSERQEMAGSIFRRAKEVFLIPKTDPACYENGITRYHLYLLVPHKVLQHFGDSPETEAAYRDHMKFSFTEGGEVYVI